MSIAKSVSTLSQFVEWVEAIGEAFTTQDGVESPWFRGVGNAAYKLVPSLYRSNAGRESMADDELRAEFMRKALPLVAGRYPRNDWEWYFLMQHYRAPTRLLDWTDSALVALYFALTSWSPAPEGKSATKPAVWALNPWALNRHHEWIGPVGVGWPEIDRYLRAPFDPRRIPTHPAAIDPTYCDHRMVAQQSRFTIHGTDVRGLNEMGIPLKGALFQLVIDADRDDVDYLLQAMTRLGITETTIFPDLEGLSRELRLEHGLDRRPPKAT